MKRFVAILVSVVILISVLPISALATTSSRMSNSDIVRYTVLVLDRSADAGFEYNGQHLYTASTSINYVKQAATSFLRDVNSAAGENHVAVVAFNESATVLADFNSSINSISKAISNLTASSDVRNIAVGLEKAEELIDGISDSNAVKNVILVTTGMTNDGPHDYDGKYDSSTVGSSWYRIKTGVNLYAYANHAISTADRLKTKSTLYVLGLFQSMSSVPVLGKDVAEFFRLTASDLATSFNTFVDVDDPTDIEFAFGEIADGILSESSKVYYRKFEYLRSVSGAPEADDVSDCYYTDSYFFEDSARENPSLASMSLALELSAFSSSYNKSTQKWNFNDKIRNIKNLLIGDQNRICGNCDMGNDCDHWRGLGFSNFSANQFWQSYPTTESIGVCAASKVISSNGTDKYTLVALAIRGGGYGSEWGSNFELGMSGNHKGFDNAAKNTIKWLNSYLSQIDTSYPIKLWIVGYSRAAITANLVAGKLIDKPSQLTNGKLSASNIYCYAFEPPQGLIGDGSSYKYRNIHNYVNVNDLVPMVAPSTPQWDFTRYNSNIIHYFPHKTTYNAEAFTNARIAMKKELNKLGCAPYYNYGILDQLDVSHFRVDLAKWWPGGSPLWWFETSTIETHDIISNGLDYLFGDVIKERTTYSVKLEYTVKTLAGIFLHYDGASKGAQQYLGQTISNNLSIKTFFNCIKNVFTMDNFKYIFAPVVEISFKSPAKRLEEVKERAHGVISKSFADFSVIFAADQIVNSIPTVIDMLVDALVDIAKDILNNNTQDINTISDLIAAIEIVGFQPHYPEVTYAWVRSEDPNFNPSLPKYIPSTTTRIIHINCPVDVYVYDSQNVLRASFIDDQPSEKQDQIHYVNDAGEKVIFLSCDEDYHILIKARGNGVVNYSLSEYDYLYESRTYLRNYYDIVVQKGDEITAIVPAFTDEERLIARPNGSTVAYRLSINGTNIENYEEFRGSDVLNKVHHLTLEIEGNGGKAWGAGDYLQGNFASLQAMPYKEGSFQGWYIDNKLVSIDLNYRMAIRSDETITAKFDTISIPHLSVTASEGGTVIETDGYFPETAEIPIVAQAKEGWVFSYWELKGDGAIIDSNKAETSFIMSVSDASLVAHFTPLEIPETGDDEPLLFCTVFVSIGIVCICWHIRKRKEKDGALPLE